MNLNDILNPCKVVRGENTADWQASLNLPAIDGDKYDVAKGEAWRHEAFIRLNARVAKYRDIAAQKPELDALADQIEKFLTVITRETSHEFWNDMANYSWRMSADDMQEFMDARI